ncbi:MAG TPA: hypothetical protein VG456_10390 [Candidatus Sulfopaludibacter sp.]|jgi:hypothetical protein|nr:hypothetical protein [Candidatus Sulfopaludibacter sp.]
MNCQEFWDRMPELSNQLLRDESEHLVDCADCARLWQRQGTLREGMRRLSADLGSVQAPARVEAGLVAAFRAQAHRRNTVPARHVWMPLASGIAAAVLVAIGLLLVRDRPPEKPRHRAPNGVELAALPAAVDLAVDDQLADSDGFIPLPNAETIAPDENVNVVRVEVPRSAMLAVGLTVSAEQASELVEADIKMGSNGLARAVRFVNE